MIQIMLELATQIMSKEGVWPNMHLLYQIWFCYHLFMRHTPFESFLIIFTA
jgi:hypothetical protein